jgi:hypothetical protein
MNFTTNDIETYCSWYLSEIFTDFWSGFKTNLPLFSILVIRFLLIFEVVLRLTYHFSQYWWSVLLLFVRAFSKLWPNTINFWKKHIKTIFSYLTWCWCCIISIFYLHGLEFLYLLVLQIKQILVFLYDKLKLKQILQPPIIASVSSSFSLTFYFGMFLANS